MKAHLDLILASKHLCLLSYEKFKKRLIRLHAYKVIDIKDAVHENKKGVLSIDAPHKDPRIFNSVDDKCNCDVSTADNEQCVHSIKISGFRVDFFDKRHLQRKHVTGSLSGWKVPIRNNIAEVGDEVIENRNENNISSNITINEHTLHADDLIEISSNKDEGKEADVYFTQDDQEEVEKSTKSDQFSIDMNSNQDELEMFDKNLNCDMNTISPLSFREIRTICADILSKYENSPEKEKFLVGSMLIGMNDILYGNGTCKLNIDIDSDDQSDYVTKMKEMVNKYQSAFQPKNAF